MRRVKEILLAVLAGSFLGYLAGPLGAAEDLNQKIDLKVMYFGRPDSARQKNFVDFLSKHFTQVQAGDLAEFKPDRADPSSGVVILDYEGPAAKAPQVRLPEAYACPTITLGVMGATIGSASRLKTGHL